MRKLKWPWENKESRRDTKRRTHRMVPHSDDSVEESGAEGLSLAWRCVRGSAIVSCGGNEERAVGVDPNRRLWKGWVVTSLAELVPGSDHIAVLAVPATKSSDHVVPPAPLARSNNN